MAPSQHALVAPFGEPRERVLEIGDPARVVARQHHGDAARNLDRRQLHEIAALDDLAPQPLENAQSLHRPPGADQDHALRAFGHDALEMAMRGADRELAVDQRLLVILGEGGGQGGAHPAERLRRRVAPAPAKLDQLRRPLSRDARVAALQAIGAEQEISEASRDRDPSGARQPAAPVAPSFRSHRAGARRA